MFGLADPAVLLILKLFLITFVITLTLTAISHAMARDGSSGGVIRMVVITKDGIEKEVILAVDLEVDHTQSRRYLPLDCHDCLITASDAQLHHMPTFALLY
eukprot:gene25281-31719_t